MAAGSLVLPVATCRVAPPRRASRTSCRNLLGAPVDAILGAGRGEYEWTWVTAKADVEAAIAAIGGKSGADVVELLRRWETANGGQDPGKFLKGAGVPMEFWSRFGD
jgi:hypothetical protein